MDKLCGTWLEYKDWKVDPKKAMHGIKQLTSGSLAESNAPAKPKAQ